MVVKKIFEGVCDEEVHSDFLKFGKGEYKDKYLIDAKVQASGKIAIKTGPEFANFLVRKCLEKVEGKVAVKGIIISTIDLRDEIKFEIKKTSNFQGIRKNIIDTEVEASEIFELMEKYPRVFFALSFKGDSFNLKIRPKAPKNSKPGKGEEDAKAEFCTLKTVDPSIPKELIFDVDSFKEASINHTINITGIVYPKNLNDLKPAEVRDLAKRKGTIYRRLIIDGKESTIEHDFVA